MSRDTRVWILVLSTLTACGSTGEPGPQGPEGPQGPPGANFDAAPRLYGNGEDGALTIAAGESEYLPVDSFLQYTSVTIETGGTLYVFSGTLLRCTGDFDNDGTLVVLPAARTGVRHYRHSSASGTADDLPILAPAHPGVGVGAAQFGTLDSAAAFVAYGGRGGEGIRGQARWLTQLLPYAGGGGANPWPFGTSAQDSGGGSFHLRSGGRIANAGTIQADGTSAGVLDPCGVGGGGGGSVLLAAAMEIDNGGGLVSVKGGDGQDGIDQCGAGGGGGGGFVHMISPSIDEGAVSLDGGAAGTPSTWASTTRWIGGGGGGASAGSGGRGGGRDGAVAIDAQQGEAGQLFVLTADPAQVL